MADLFDLDFVFVVGKGGVGKTTVSASLALAAARRGKRVLVAMCNAKERLSDLYEVPPIDHRIRTVLPNVDAVNMTPAASLEEYGMMVLKVRSLYRAIFENRFVASFLRGTPGIEAWSMLGKAFYHAAERDDRGQPVYDMVILDAPATGHGLEMLRVPRVIVEVAPPGMLRRDAEEALALFQDPSRSGVVLVTLAEDMPTNETIELHRALVTELGMHPARLVVNSVLPPLFAQGEEAMLRALSSPGPGDSLAPLLRAGAMRATRERIQAEHLGRLRRELPLPSVTLPRLFSPTFGKREIETLSHGFE